MNKNNQSDLFPETLPYPLKNVPKVEGLSKRMQMEVARIMPRTPFIDLRQLVKTSIKFDMKYASEDNFAGEAFYDKDDPILLRREVALGVMQANKILRRKKGTKYSLIIYDAGRPQSAHEKMYEWAKEYKKEEYFAKPERGSIHSFGCAVDVSILYEEKPLDMGTGFDELSEFSWTSREQELSPKQKANRELLREVMKAWGFEGIDSEWWHFDFGWDRYRPSIRESLPRII